MTATKSINTMQDHDVCDVCERTLLRGEHLEVFVNGGRRYGVCELCKPHALHLGWMREGALPDYPDPSASPARRRSLFGRRRARAARAGRADGAPPMPPAPQTLDDELSFGDWSRHNPPIADPLPDSGYHAPPPPRHAPAADRLREPRHVHAIPTNDEHKIAAAVEAFNRTEHRRTVAGVARSLGAPAVNLTPDPAHAALVWIVVAWELCWYRYEVDLSDTRGSVRLDGQGYELGELQEYERVANAGADEAGSLGLLY
ncbi:MAG TPA: hypothetical protein VME01_09070 [Solirubrobacteraceae bacterium]|nr:hypothetical protein [Solirubrobacteraceae bacterium]